MFFLATVFRPVCYISMPYLDRGDIDLLLRNPSISSYRTLFGVSGASTTMLGRAKLPPNCVISSKSQG
jgi:hypothetical protein